MLLYTNTFYIPYKQLCMQFFAYTPYSLSVYSTPPPFKHDEYIHLLCTHVYEFTNDDYFG